jgi:AraC-like DNA-binding protein
MPFLIHAVAPPLSAYVNFLYMVEGPAPYGRDGIFARPAIELKFNFGDPWLVHDPRTGSDVSVCAESWCVGIWNRHHVVEWPAEINCVAASFKSGGASAFFDMPLSDLHNGIVPLDAIWGRAADEARERLHAARTPELRFRLFEEILLGRLNENAAATRIVTEVSARIEDRHGALRIGTLSEDAGISQKHLITLFKRNVGCTPKELARLHRFGHTLKGIDASKPVDWTSIAHENDYFDQSHFSHDFEAHTGLNPTAYLERRRKFQAEAPDHGANLAMLVAG